MEVAEITFREEVACDSKWLWWCEPVDASLLVRVGADGAIKLAIPAIGSVERLERDEFGRVRG